MLFFFFERNTYIIVHQHPIEENQFPQNLQSHSLFPIKLIKISLHTITAKSPPVPNIYRKPPRIKSDTAISRIQIETDDRDSSSAIVPVIVIRGTGVIVS